MQRKWEKEKAVEHLVASHKHRLAAASRKIMHTMGRRIWGKISSIQQQRLLEKNGEEKRQAKWGKMGEKWGKKSREKIKKKIWKKIQKKNHKKGSS